MRFSTNTMDSPEVEITLPESLYERLSSEACAMNVPVDWLVATLIAELDARVAGGPALMATAV